MRSEQQNLKVFEIHADFCRVMSSATRLRIMWLLRDGESSVTELAEALGLAVPNVSQHLRIMRDKGALTTRKDGQTVYCRISNKRFIAGLTLIREGINEQILKNAKELNHESR